MHLSDRMGGMLGGGTQSRRGVGGTSGGKIDGVDGRLERGRQLEGEGEGEEGDWNWAKSGGEGMEWESWKQNAKIFRIFANDKNAVGIVPSVM